MNLTNLLRLGAPACVALVLAACGGSSENSSPGSVIVEVPVGGDDDDEDDDGDDDDSGSQDPVDETTVATVIPSALEDVISNSGESAGAAFGNKPIYTIDVSETSALDPAGLVLGNDVIFEIAGGAARIAAPDGAAVSSGGGLPECQLDMAPGAVIAGGSSTDFLIIEQGCALMADGTADQPIVFTARAEVDGDAEDNDRGLWGGRHQRLCADQRLSRGRVRRHGRLHQGGQGQLRSLRRRQCQRQLGRSALRQCAVRRFERRSGEPAQRHRFPRCRRRHYRGVRAGPQQPG